MGRPALPDDGRGGNWLASLIEATEVVAASAETCDPAIVKAISGRLVMRTEVRPLFDLLRTTSKPPLSGIELPEGGRGFDIRLRRLPLATLSETSRRTAL